MTLNHSANPGRHALKVRKDDLYETPDVAVHALLRAERIPHYVWEPACGPGAIVNVLRAAGHEVIASDLVDYGDPTHFYRRDFLMERAAPERCQAIITNPPYKLADEFVGHALQLVPLVIMLLRLPFLESARRTAIIEGGRLARVHIFRQRLPRMHRGGWRGHEASSSMCFCWFVWDRAHQGPTELRRISWEPAE